MYLFLTDSKIRDQNKNVQELLDEIDKLEGFRHYKLDLEKSKEDNERCAIIQRFHG